MTNKAKCTSQTADWSTCENTATRPDGLCGVHGRMADRNRAALRVDPPVCRVRQYNGLTCRRDAVEVVEGRGYCTRHLGLGYELRAQLREDAALLASLEPAELDAYELAGEHAATGGRHFGRGPVASCPSCPVVPAPVDLGDLVLTPRGEPAKVVHLYSSGGERHAFVKREIDGRSIAFAVSSLRPLDREAVARSAAWAQVDRAFGIVDPLCRRDDRALELCVNHGGRFVDGPRCDKLERTADEDGMPVVGSIGDRGLV